MTHSLDLKTQRGKNILVGNEENADIPVSCSTLLKTCIAKHVLTKLVKNQGSINCRLDYISCPKIAQVLQNAVVTQLSRSKLM